MQENSTWKYKVTSYANTLGLSNDEIKKILDCYNHEEYQDFRNEMREKNKQYDNHPVAKWQVEKSDTIEQTWHNNIKYEINGDRVDVSIEFEVSFPDDFDRGDVIEWCEGFNRLGAINPMTYQKEIIDLHQIGAEIPEIFTKKLLTF